MELTTLRRRRYVASLALASSLILIVGWLARPREVPQSPPPVPSETELEQLARRTERRSLESMTKFFAGLARDIEPSLVFVRGAGITGVAWNNAYIITAPLTNRASANITIAADAAGEASAQITLAGPQLPLAVVEMPRAIAALSSVHRATTEPQPGDWTMGVWRSDTGPTYGVGNFRQSRSTTCMQAPIREVVSSLSLTGDMVGGGLFDMDGSLLGVILPCRDRLAAVAPESIDALVARAGAPGQRLLSIYGLGLAPLSEPEQTYFQLRGGLIVRELWIGSAGEAAGLQPGDVMVALDGRSVVAIDDLAALIPASGQTHDLQVRRGSKTVAIALPPAAPPETLETTAGLVLESPPRTYRIESVMSDSRAARAGIQPGDRLLRVDRVQPRSLPEARRLFTIRRSSPMLLEIERDQRRLAIVVPELKAP